MSSPLSTPELVIEGGFETYPDVDPEQYTPVIFHKPLPIVPMFTPPDEELSNTLMTSWRRWSPITVFNRTWGDYEEWKRFRTTVKFIRPTIAISELPNAALAGYRSYAWLLRSVHAPGQIPTEIGDYMQPALEHGRNTEAEALDKVMRLYRSAPFPMGGKDPPTRVWDLSDHLSWNDAERVECQLMGTYDGLLVDPQDPQIPIIVEIKCPYIRAKYDKELSKSDIKHARRDFKKAHPIGKLAYFIQCAAYAVAMNTNHFVVYVYFKGPSNTAVAGLGGLGVAYHYRMTSKVRSFILMLMKNVLLKRPVPKKKYMHSLGKEVMQNGLVARIKDNGFI